MTTSATTCTQACIHRWQLSGRTIPGMGTAQAVVIVRERLQPVLGDEVGVTAREVSVDGERIRLGAANLQLAARVLRENGVEPVDFEALVVVSTDGDLVIEGVGDRDPKFVVRMIVSATIEAGRHVGSDTGLPGVRMTVVKELPSSATRGPSNANGKDGIEHLNPPSDALHFRKSR